ncbi:MAG: glutamine--fructose-6-phosphate transaminase (isomerizing) [Lachnospiraceae bacterium]|nr:glutamine--fructose-6-phosphate transaminase (isomerizing) [Lachnospiraceae bacterium]
MCGIVGYVGREQAAPILLEGLSKLEYRGYDSAGIVVRDGEKKAEVIKAKGKLENLSEKTNNGLDIKGKCGIGHTRWATHGEPSELNAHPHVSDDMNVVAVHNGIIENYQELKDKLIRKGYEFYSQTDTEILTKLVDYYYKKYKVGPIDAIAKTMVRVRGTYAIAVMFKDYPNEIYVARKDSPLILGITDGDCYLASDVPAILKHTRNVYYIDNLEMARMHDGQIDFYNLDGDIVPKDTVEIKWDAEAAEKGGYEHFMMKEIHEQPRIITETFNSVYKNGKIDLSEIGLTDDIIKNISKVTIVACGSAYHVGMVAQYVIEDLVRVPVRVELASEFRYRSPILSEDDYVILISQSGETEDTKKAVSEAKAHGAKTLAIVNVVGSSIAREADNVFYTLAGPEISVATTKAYSAQLIAVYAIATEFARVKGKIDEEKYNYYINEILTLPSKIEKIIENKERIQWIANKFSSAKDVFFIGRGIDYAICLEGSLKMKEISYIHSEAYAAGELKHGPIALIEDGILVISCLTQEDLFEKTVSNMVEVKSRGAVLLAVTTYGHYNIEDNSNYVTYIPKTDEHFMASLAVVPMQLMGYYLSVSKGIDVDKPKNLAKSVTVE